MPYRLLAPALLSLGLLSAARAETPEPAPKDKAPAGKSTDVQLTERLLQARRQYQLALETLRGHFLASGDLERARWAEEELIQYHRVSKQAFVQALELPPPTLQANKNIPEANELYRRAMSYKDKGWRTDYIDNQRRAELLFQRLLSEYPESDKISDTAYQLGDIYESPAFKQYGRAAWYFERCFQWNPKTNFDARLRSARLYERVSERNHALEIYKEIVSHETDAKRIEEAQRRIAELGGRKK